MSDVIIVGGGAIGLSIAWRAAQRGLDVAVVDEQPGRGASWAAAGMLAPVTEVHFGEEELLALNVASAALFPSFAAELHEASGIDPGYRACGTLMVARDADENAVLDEVFGWQQRLGLDATRLTGRECRQVEPALAPGTRGGILVADDHQVDNRALVTALLEVCTRAGVVLVRDSAAGLEVERDAPRIRLEVGGILQASQIVLAMGWRTATLAGTPPELRVVRPVKGQLLHLRARRPEPWTKHNVRGLEAYVVSRSDGRVVIGATVEEKGDDSSVTAGGIHLLLDAVRRLLPDTDELELVEAVAGLRPGTPDNAPLLGSTSIPGVIAAAGHYRNGILQTPLTSEAIAGLLLEGTTKDAIRAFDPLRFGRPAEVPAQ